MKNVDNTNPMMSSTEPDQQEVVAHLAAGQQLEVVARDHDHAQGQAREHRDRHPELAVLHLLRGRRRVARALGGPARRLLGAFLVRATAGDLSQSRLRECGGAAIPAPVACSAVRVLVIDNYDSFVYNLVQYLGELGAEPVVHRNDAITLAGAARARARRGAGVTGPGQPRRTRRRRGLHRRHPRLRRGRRPRARRLLRAPVHRPDLRRSGRARPARDARQDVADHPRRTGRVHRAPVAVHRHPLPLAGGRARDRARRARDQRRVGRRPGHGVAPPRPADRRACSSTPSRSSPRPVTRSSPTSCPRRSRRPS